MGRSMDIIPVDVLNKDVYGRFGITMTPCPLSHPRQMGHSDIDMQTGPSYTRIHNKRLPCHRTVY